MRVNDGSRFDANFGLEVKEILRVSTTAVVSAQTSALKTRRSYACQRWQSFLRTLRFVDGAGRDCRIRCCVERIVWPVYSLRLPLVGSVIKHRMQTA